MIFAENKKGVKIIRRILSALWWIILLLLAFVLVNILGAKLSGRVPSIFGYSVMNIVSGSMEDEIPKGSYILIKRISPEEVEKDDVICFYSTDPKIYGIPNTHRVVEEPIVTEDGIEFITKGDRNPVNDTETAKGELLIGVYVKTLDGLTAFVRFLDGNTLIFVIIGLQICIILMSCYIVSVYKNEKKSKDCDNSEDEKQKRKEKEL